MGDHDLSGLRARPEDAGYPVLKTRSDSLYAPLVLPSRLA